MAGRRRERGVRLARGAAPAPAVQMVVDWLLLVGLGIVMGLVGVVALGGGLPSSSTA